MWEASVKVHCWRNNFKLIQFIVDDDVEMLGSDWQKLVCEQINIPEQKEVLMDNDFNANRDSVWF
jgi:hypothetical protein